MESVCWALTLVGTQGGGLGGILPQVGIDLPGVSRLHLPPPHLAPDRPLPAVEFQALINRNRTEHVFDAINSTGKATDEPNGSHKARAACGSFSSVNATAGPSSSKRPRTDELDSPMEMASNSAASMYHLPSLGEAPFPGGSTSYGGSMYIPRTSSSAGSPAVDAAQRDADAIESVRPKVADTPGAVDEPQEDTIQELFSMVRRLR